MDGPRYRSINNPKLTESDDSEFKSASEESNGSFQTDEEAHEFWNGHEKTNLLIKIAKIPLSRSLFDLLFVNRSVNKYLSGTTVPNWPFNCITKLCQYVWQLQFRPSITERLRKKYA